MSKSQIKIKFNDLDILNKKFNYQIIKELKKDFNENNFIFGKSVEKLEKKLGKFTGSKFVATVGSGTDAILLSLLSLNLKKGDEIIIPSFSWLSVAEVVLMLGFKPIYIDTSLVTFNMDISLIENHITKKTKGIISTSLFGRSIDLIFIKNFCKKNKLFLIEDAAQNFGSFINKKNACNIADLTITSFFPSKTLGCYGDGGAIFTNNSKIFKKIKYLRNHGQQKYSKSKMIGLNSRIGTIQATILLKKLHTLNLKIKSQKLIYLKYQNFFLKKKIGGFPLVRGKKFDDANGQFSLLVKNRTKFIKYLKIFKIPFKIYYPLPLYKQFNQKPKFSLKNTEYLCNHIISLPYNELSQARFKKTLFFLSKIIILNRKIFFEKN